MTQAGTPAHAKQACDEAAQGAREAKGAPAARLLRLREHSDHFCSEVPEPSGERFGDQRPQDASLHGPRPEAR